MDRFIKTASDGAQPESKKRDPVSFFTAVWKNKYTIWVIILLMEKVSPMRKEMPSLMA